MIDVIASLKDRFDGEGDDSPMRSEFPGGFWLYRADEDSTIPCLIAQTISGGESRRNTGASYSQAPDYQFSVYASSPDECERLMKLFANWLKDALRNALGEDGYVMDHRILDERCFEDRYPDSAGGLVYHYSRDYEIMVQRRG